MGGTIDHHYIAVAAVVVILLFVNLLHNRWSRDHYMMICVGATILLLAIARLDGLSWQMLGVARSQWKSGVLWSAIVVGAVVAFYAVAVSLPATRKGFRDKRAAEHGWFGVLYQSTIRIPFGTALMEETAFRGVLLAAVWVVWGWWTAVIVSSVLFGLWHILPSLEFHQSNEAATVIGDGWRAKLVSVVLTVLGTGAAGLGFCLLRDVSNSLFPPIALHAALNGIGLAVSWAFARRLSDL